MPHWKVRPSITRRTALRTLVAAGSLPLLRFAPPAQAATVEAVLRPAPAPWSFDGGNRTEAWAYNGTLPGPVLRARQGDRLRVVLENGLPEPTTIHWHGIRLPHGMDGVPELTQPPVAPGGRFVYEFDLPDAGTFWYHPHQNSGEQLGRGLTGALIVEERAPIAVDREILWVLSDVRLTAAGGISPDFADRRDRMHAGRLGNLATINGRRPAPLDVRAGERIRLRLINVANARIFALRFGDLAPTVIALDGQPVAPHAADLPFALGPGMRADLVLDCLGAPGSRAPILDSGTPDTPPATLTEIAYADSAPLRAGPAGPPPRLPDNPLAEPDLARALRTTITFGGGMLSDRIAVTLDGEATDLVKAMVQGWAWALNGAIHTGHHHMEPLVTVPRGATAVLDLVNQTKWRHPIHLHGHSFRLLTRNGAPVAHRPFLDTVLLAPDERAEVAFVGDNPGDWMFHCHILEHQASGMMGILRVL